MAISVSLVDGETTLPWRELHRQEMNCQIVLDSWHGRRWVDSYALYLNGRPVGYGLVGGVRGDPKNTVVEYYVLPEARRWALPLFREMIQVSGAELIEAQTNDRLLTLMLYDCAQSVESQVILFADAAKTAIEVPGAVVRRAEARDHDALQQQGLDAEAGWVLEVEGMIAGAGGVLFHYNPPYGDVYMAVAEAMRRRGLGSFLVQELKRISYEQGKIPAARCNAANVASRATLERAGFLPCARVLVGRLE